VRRGRSPSLALDCSHFSDLIMDETKFQQLLVTKFDFSDDFHIDFTGRADRREEGASNRESNKRQGTERGPQKYSDLANVH